MRTTELRASRAKLIEDARTLIAGDAPSGDDFTQFDRMMDEADRLEAQFTRIEQADTLERDLHVLAGQKAEVKGISTDHQLDIVATEKKCITAYLRGDVRSLNDVEREHMERRDIRAAAMGITTPAGGGYTVAPEWADELLVAMKAQGGMRAASRSITTDTGASLPWVVTDDTASVASIINENVQITEDTELAFNQVPLGAFTYKSGVMLISLQLLNDTAFDFDSVIRDAIAGRFVRKQNADFTTGGGTTLPRGVMTDAVVGTTGIVGSTLTVGFKDLVALEHSIDPVYRPGAVFMMHDTTLRAVKQLVDGQQRPLFMAGITVGAPDSLLGYPIVINQDMPVMAANAKSILFGNFNNYIIRDVRGAQMLVLRERYADFLQIGYISFMRSDGRLVSAAAPIKWYANSAT